MPFERAGQIRLAVWRFRLDDRYPAPVLLPSPRKVVVDVSVEALFRSNIIGKKDLVRLCNGREVPSGCVRDLDPE